MYLVQKSFSSVLKHVYTAFANILLYMQVMSVLRIKRNHLPIYPWMLKCTAKKKKRSFCLRLSVGKQSKEEEWPFLLDYDFLKVFISNFSQKPEVLGPFTSCPYTINNVHKHLCFRCKLFMLNALM